MKTPTGSLIKNSLLRALFVAVLVFQPFNLVHAQKTKNAQANNKEINDVLETLSVVAWLKDEAGYEYFNIQSQMGVRLVAVKFAQKDFFLSLQQKSDKDGNFIDDYAQNSDALIAINGGFFAKQKNGDLYSVGLLKDKGKTFSRAWRKKGGYLVLGDKGTQILATSTKLPKDAINVLQSKPVIIEQGGKWALMSNNKISKNRSLVCLLKDGQMILMSVSGTGLSLYEAGWLLRTKEKGGWFGCDSAIALDGGGSSQLFVREQPSLKVYGSTKIPNALIVKAK
ncbi:MAG: phosphodiester glycosidase family protein [Nitratireductor sp.]